MTNPYAAMKKKCPGPSCPGCSSAACMADGGKVKGVHKDSSVKGVHKDSSDQKGGVSDAGSMLATHSYSGKPGMLEGAKGEHKRVLSEMQAMPKPNLYAEGGEVEGSDDGEAMLDQCASECMKAIESGDKTAFRDSLHAMIGDFLMRMQEVPDGSDNADES